jgi:hypothetical protein
MKLSDINSITSFAIKEARPDLILTPPVFERLLNKAQVAQFADLISAFETSKIVSMELSKFKRNMGETTPPLSIDKFGHATMPDECYLPSHLTFKYVRNGVVVGIYDIVLLSDREYNDRKASNLMAPSYNYPIANIQSNMIRFAPINLKRANFDYIKFPTYPKYSVTHARGFQEWDESTSSVWEFGDISSIQIIQRLLAELSISTTIEQLQQIQKQQQ